MPPANRRRRPADDEESDEDSPPRQRPNRNDSEGEPEDDESGDDMDVDGDDGQGADAQLAKKLIRYAISCEYSRTPIRRDGIKERVLGNQGRAFRRVFTIAQKQLRAVWGMELRELPVREKMSLHEKRQAMKSQSQPKTGSGAYVLSSTLPEAYRSPMILGPSRTPSADDEATYVGFYTMVVSTIYLNGGELSEQKLRRYLSRLNADQNVSMDKTEVILRRMEKQGYVVKKIEKPPIGQDGDLTVTWHVGPRGREEVGIEGVMGMVREVYGGTNEDLEKKLRASLNIKERTGQADEDEDADADADASRMETVAEEE